METDIATKIFFATMVGFLLYIHRKQIRFFFYPPSRIETKFTQYLESNILIFNCGCEDNAVEFAERCVGFSLKEIEYAEGQRYYLEYEVDIKDVPWENVKKMKILTKFPRRIHQISADEQEYLYEQKFIAIAGKIERVWTPKKNRFFVRGIALAWDIDNEQTDSLITPPLNKNVKPTKPVMVLHGSEVRHIVGSFFIVIKTCLTIFTIITIIYLYTDTGKQNFIFHLSISVAPKIW